MARLSQDELNSMLPEKRKAYLEKRKRKVQRNRRILAVSVTVVLAMLAVIVLSLTVFFKVDTIKILGDSIYDESQILNESGLRKGDNLFLSNTTAAKIRIEKNLPYISNAAVKRKFPSSVIIEITGTQASCCFKCSNGTAIADKSLKVLELAAEDEVSPEITRVNTKNTFSAGIGENIIDYNSGGNSSDEIKKEAALVKTVFDSIEESGIEHLTEINVSSPGNIYCMYQNRLKLNLGSTDKLTYKLKSAVEIIKKEDEINPSEKGDIFLNDTKKFYVSPEKK
ncbi:MAG: FtsQ-type POTRA domain-containing protein [Clostridia bacterium]|nr:FtsQ-type POTRA domain-containing protein [Clostridia bacterium]